jgi:hypothetical protein
MRLEQESGMSGLGMVPVFDDLQQPVNLTNARAMRPWGRRLGEAVVAA